MAKLFTTIAQVKEYVSSDFTNEIDVLKPHLEKAEDDIIAKYLGQDQFDAIVTFWNNGSPGTDDDQLKLMHYARAIIANWAVAYYVPFGQVQISQSGVHITSTAEKKTAFEHQVKAVIESLESMAASKIELMLTFLEANTDVFTDWKSSELYAQLVGLLVNKATIFNQYVHIGNSRLKFIELLPDIRNAERFHVLTSIGQDYYDELITQIKDGTVSEDNSKVLAFLRSTVANAAYGAFSLRRGNDSSSYEDTAIRSIKQAIEYLNNNASASKYATFFNSDKYTAPADYSQKFYDNESDSGIVVM